MEVLFPKTRLAAEGPTWEEDPPRSLGGTPEITTQEILIGGAFPGKPIAGGGSLSQSQAKGEAMS
jgi:hypothetical protein